MSLARHHLNLRGNRVEIRSSHEAHYTFRFLPLHCSLASFAPVIFRFQIHRVINWMTLSGKDWDSNRWTVASRRFLPVDLFMPLEVCEEFCPRVLIANHAFTSFPRLHMQMPFFQQKVMNTTHVNSNAHLFAPASHSCPFPLLSLSPLTWIFRLTTHFHRSKCSVAFCAHK